MGNIYLGIWQTPILNQITFESLKMYIIGAYHFPIHVMASLFAQNLAGSENLVSQRIIWQHSLNLFEIFR